MEFPSIQLVSTALDHRFKLIKYLDEGTKVEVTELVISNVERLVSDINCTMANSDCTIMVDDTQYTLVESGFRSLLTDQEQSLVIKRQKSQHLTFYWDQRRTLEEGQ